MNDLGAVRDRAFDGTVARVRRRCLLVLGMHWSDTSALTRVSGLAGAKLPARLMGAGAGDPTGQCEPDALVAYIDRQLAEVGSAWNDWGQLDLSRLGPGCCSDVKAGLRNIVARSYGGAPLFVLSDPRVCRLAGLVVEALESSGVEVAPVLVVCNPLEVVALLESRDGIGQADAALLWLRHVVDAEAATRHLPRAITTCDGLISNRTGELERIRSALSLSFPNSPDAIGELVDAVLAKESGQNSHGIEAVVLDPLLRGWVSDVFAAMRILARAPDSQQAITILDGTRRAFDAACPTLKSLVASAKSSGYARFEAKLSDADKRISILIEQFEQSEAARRDLVADIVENVRSLKAEKGRSQRLEEQLAQRNREAQAELSHIHHVYQNSTSWKLTRPIRWVKKLVAPTRLAAARKTWDLLLDSALMLKHASWTNGTIQPENGDGQLLCELRTPIPPGWYRIRSRILVDGKCRPRIYFDFGDGYSELQSALAMPTGNADEYEARFYLPRTTRLIRFDPTDDNRTLVIRELRLARFNTLSRYLVLARLGTKFCFRSLLELQHGLKKYGAIKHAGRVIDLSRYVVRTVGKGDYRAWIAAYDYNDERDNHILKAKIARLAHKPLISVVMPVYETPKKLLDDAIRSVVDQVYTNWELCISNDASPDARVRRQLDDWAARDRRIKVVHREVNGHICHATNSAFELSTGSWIALLDHDDLLRPHALAEVALALDDNPEATIVYSDEDKIDEGGSRFDAHFKCDYAPELLRSMNYFNHLTVHRADLVREAGGWRPGFEGSQDYDLNLRIVERVDPRSIVHIPKVLYHWRAVAGSTALAGSQKNYAYRAGFRALEEHIQRTGQNATVKDVPGVPFYRVRHEIKQPAPLVSLIIPTRDRVDLLRVAVDTILRMTTYAPYEIIVMDNNSEQLETLAYFEELSARDNVRVIPHPYPFNFSAICNHGVHEANGSIVGLVNNDIEVIAPDWLSEMVSWVQHDRVGCVGAKLMYPNDTLQHGGVVLGVGGVANHAHKHHGRDAPGYFGRAVVVQNFSAVTAACLLVRKAVYQQVGGMDEVRLRIAFNDVDFCLKVREAGYDNIWTPFAELYHHESPSRGTEDTPEKLTRFVSEVETMKARWGKKLMSDPYYSPNLTKEREDFSFAD